MSVKLLYNNYLDDSVLSGTEVSSEKSSFPNSNTKKNKRRSKVWRTDGYWNITSANDEIDFEETAATPLTATIANAEYSTTTSLLAAIKTALDAAGASTYTVSLDTSSNKFKIVSNGAGGGGIFTLLWTTETPFGDLIGFDTSANDSGALTYTADNLRIHENEWVRWDMGMASNPTAFVMNARKEQGLNLTSSAVVKLQANATDAWSSPSWEQTITANNDVYSLFDSTGLGDTSYRYWRVLITDNANPDTYIEVSKFFLGEYYAPTSGSVQFPFEDAYTDYSDTQYSVAGQSFSESRSVLETFTLKWDFLTDTEKEQFDTIFKEYKTAYPLFIAIDSDANISSGSNYYTRYCKFAAPIRWIKDGATYWSCDMRLREEL